MKIDSMLRRQIDAAKPDEEIGAIIAFNQQPHMPEETQKNYDLMLCELPEGMNLPSECHMFKSIARVSIMATPALLRELMKQELLITEMIAAGGRTAILL